MGVNQNTLAGRISSYFENQGWNLGKGYEELLMGLGTKHTYFSFAWSEKKGAYVTVYFAPGMERGM